MDLKLNERKLEANKKYDNLRLNLANNYRDLIPDIDNHIYGYQNPDFDFRFLARDYSLIMNNKRFNDLSKIILDIRNNNTPTSAYSNSISNTDNKFSNETKKMCKLLLAKGWTNNEVAYELEKVYGSGAILYYKGIEPEPTLSTYFYRFCFKIISFYGFYKFIRFTFKKIRKI
jgi:hypothetical protein